MVDTSRVQRECKQAKVNPGVARTQRRAIVGRCRQQALARVHMVRGSQQKDTRSAIGQVLRTQVNSFLVELAQAPFAISPVIQISKQSISLLTLGKRRAACMHGPSRGHSMRSLRVCKEQSGVGLFFANKKYYC